MKSFFSSVFSSYLLRFTILFCAVLLLSGCTGSQTSSVEIQDNTALAQCLTEQGFIMYGVDSCQFCREQKAIFTLPAFEEITYVECDKQPTACELASIQAFPTRIGPEYNETGLKTLSELAQASGCAYGDTVATQES